MRAESDVQGPFRSEAPACDHCGFPLLDVADFCPYCERPVGEAAGADGSEGRDGARSERLLLIAAGALCAALAVVSIAAAMLV